jgi:hypothetical protein
MEKSVFETLKEVDVSKFVEKKNKLDYLSWAHAWGELKSKYPLANYFVYESATGMNYHNDGMTCWVKCSVTVNELEHIEYLPIMDNYNKSILVSKVSSFDVNKSIQRCLTKAIARHGLGLNVYAGEDFPTEQDKSEPSNEKIEVLKELREVVKGLMDKGYNFNQVQLVYLQEVESEYRTVAEIKVAIEKLRNIKIG